MIFYAKINIDNNKYENIVFNALRNNQNTSFFKTNLYPFEVNNGLIQIKGCEDRTLIRTIRYIDDIVDKELRKYDSKFNIVVSLDANIKTNFKSNVNVVLLFNSEKINIALGELKDTILKKEIRKNKVHFTFDFFSAFEKSKIINLKTKRGTMMMQTFFVKTHNKLFTIAYVGELKKQVNLRIHYMCETSEIFDSIHCDCKIQLEKFKEIMFEKGGLIIYAHEEGRGFGLVNKINAYYNSEVLKMDTVDAMKKETGKSEMRKFDISGEIVRQLGIKNVKLWTNNPLKMQPLEDRQIVVERESSWYKTNSKKANEYLKSKKKRMGHIC